MVHFTIPNATAHATFSGEEVERQAFSGHLDVSLSRNTPNSDSVYNGDAGDNDGDTQESWAFENLEGGDRETVCSIGIMRRGLMYAATCGGEPARRYWGCEWDECVTAGSPYG